MNYYACPHCAKPARSGFRAAFTGWGSFACQSCGKQVGFPGWWFFVLTPLVTAVVIVPIYTDSAETASSLAVILTSITFVLDRLVPLQKK